MGLDIGFVHKVEWAPRPGWQFWECLSGYAVDDSPDTSLTLNDITEAFAEFKDGCPDAVDMDNAAEFVRWCRRYWTERGLGAEDGIGLVLWY